MVYFHGTTAENAECIDKSGFAPEENTWSCSVGNDIYFWKPDPYDEETEMDEDSVELDGRYQRGFCNAVENAQITAAYRNSMAESVVVYALHIPEEYMEQDLSCPNMDGAVCINADELNHLLWNGVAKIEKYIAKEAYDPGLRFFVLAGVLNNEYLNGLDEKTFRIAKAVAKADCMFVDVMDELYPACIQVQERLPAFEIKTAG